MNRADVFSDIQKRKEQANLSPSLNAQISHHHLQFVSPENFFSLSSSLLLLPSHHTPFLFSSSMNTAFIISPSLYILCSSCLSYPEKSIVQIRLFGVFLAQQSSIPFLFLFFSIRHWLLLILHYTLCIHFTVSNSRSFPEQSRRNQRQPGENTAPPNKRLMQQSKK